MMIIETEQKNKTRSRREIKLKTAKEEKMSVEDVNNQRKNIRDEIEQKIKRSSMRKKKKKHEKPMNYCRDGVAGFVVD